MVIKTQNLIRTCIGRREKYGIKSKTQDYGKTTESNKNIKF